LAFSGAKLPITKVLAGCSGASVGVVGVGAGVVGAGVVGAGLAQAVKGSAANINSRQTLPSNANTFLFFIDKNSF
jgi:hypothetical protein